MTSGNFTLPPASSLLGRAIDAAGQPLPVDAPMSADAHTSPVRAAHANGELYISGIKVIDMFAPMVRGGITTMTGTTGVGLVVVTSQLIHDLAVRSGGCAVIASIKEAHMDVEALVADLRSEGVMQHVIVVSGQPGETDARPIADTALALAEDLRGSGRETLLVLHEPLLTPATAGRLADRARGGAAALTVLVWQLLAPEQLAANPLPPAPIASDGRLVFSRVLGGQNIWPAVDPARSESRLLADETLSAEHRRVAAAARALLRETGVTEGAGETSAPLGGRARRALLFGSQPFVVAEPFTALPGAYVPLAETIRDYAAIVDGRCDALPEEAVRFTGALGALPSGA
jgi:F-type H+-transporting ATPase subunit beta